MRPQIDDQFIAPDGVLLTVRAVWPGGVVFDQERRATLDELRDYDGILPAPVIAGRLPAQTNRDHNR